MRVPYNESTRHIYETIAKVAREIAAREGATNDQSRKERAVEEEGAA